MLHRLTALLAVVAVAAACDQGTGPINARGLTTFAISQTNGTGATASLITLDDHDGGPGPHQNTIPLSAIKRIDVVATGIAALPIGNDSLEDLGWVKLLAPKPVDLNLLALPTNPDSGLVVLRGTLPPGKYGHLRILFDTSTITFAQTVTLSHDHFTRTFHADSTYPLFIGGFGMPQDTVSDHDDDDANHFGIVVPATTFTIAKDTTSTIAIVFNPGASVRRVLVTGHGLRLAPVIVAAKHEDADSDKDHEGSHH